MILRAILFQAEERLKLIEEQMKIDQEKQRLKRKEDKKAKRLRAGSLLLKRKFQQTRILTLRLK